MAGRPVAPAYVGAMRHLGVAGAVVDGRWVPGDVAVDGDRIGAVGLAGGTGRGIAVPGFVDLQVNGFGGVDLSDPDVDLEGYRAASAAKARSGVTSFLATFPTAPWDRYPALLAAAAAAAREPLPGARVQGVHLEGPWLSPARAGAHEASWLRPPDVAEARQLLARAPVALVTLAPEVPGGLALVRALVAEGVAVAVGHSDATAAEANAAFDAGAVAVTHLWNAQRAPTAREPGVTGAALARDGVWACVIADLAHVCADVLRFTLAVAGDRVVVVTDAVAACGLGPGEHRVGERTVVVAGGAARDPDGRLLGSATPMDAALRNLLGLGVDLLTAVDAVTARPAALLGRDDLGRLQPGGPADVVVLDDAMAVHDVLVAGRSVTG